MNSYLKKLVGLFAVLTCFAVPTKAFSWDWCDNNYDCCYDSCNTDCCCGPLNESRFGVTVKGGVDPIHWSHRPRIWVTNPSLLVPVFSVGRAPKFDDIFDLPWTVGGELNYNLSCNSQLFIEFNYIQASGKRHSFPYFNDLSASARHRDYEAWNGYLGARYYFSRSWLCDRVAPFVGFKAGFVNHREVKRTLTVEDVVVDSGTFHHGRAGVSAGLQVGFDVRVWDCVFAVLNFEFVASEPHRANNAIAIDSPVLAGGITNVSVGPLGTEISFPITLGLRYEF